jgi:hypothetical protein
MGIFEFHPTADFFESGHHSFHNPMLCIIFAGALRKIYAIVGKKNPHDNNTFANRSPRYTDWQTATQKAFASNPYRSPIVFRWQRQCSIPDIGNGNR